MNKAARMMIARDAVRRSEYDEKRYGMGGREMKQTGAYGYGDNGVESRRRRDGRGRYMEGGSDYRNAMIGFDRDNDDIEMRMPMRYPRNGGDMPMDMRGGNGYGDIYAHGTIYAPNAMNKPMGGMMGGYGGDMNQPVDEHTARTWVNKMDGGEKFKMEQAEQFRQAHCPHCDKYEFYVALNAMYSDYCEVAKKLGVDKPEFYIFMAKAFLDDKDAGPHKLRKYMETIPK